jgi:hypothetical protein
MSVFMPSAVASPLHDTHQQHEMLPAPKRKGFTHFKTIIETRAPARSMSQVRMLQKQSMMSATARRLKVQ